MNWANPRSFLSDKSYVAPVPIWDVDYEVPEGHRIGVAVHSSNAAWALPEDDSAAQNTLTLGGPAWLDLPLSAGAASLRNDLAGDPRGDADGPAADDDASGGGSGDGGAEGVGSGGGGVGDAGDDRTLPATGAGAALPGLVLLGLSARLATARRRR